MTANDITILPGSRFRAAFLLAVLADALQIIVFPLFIEGAPSPADDVLDFGIGAVLTYLLGWHWEFLPSFLGKLVPGVDLAPFWTLAVANVYRNRDGLPSRQKRVQWNTRRSKTPGFRKWTRNHRGSTLADSSGARTLQWLRR
jgi:hypothetical protein